MTNWTNSTNGTNGTNRTNEIYYDVECERHILTTFIIPDILLISAFVYGLYIFRWVQTEQLSTLTEAVSAVESRESCYDILADPPPSFLLLSVR